mmetsp:Transcript_21664/g.67268  ORF Transcript_21664/g.67268 Transcript_21664/m.67268 type:complete len:270 (-) Transcript_21664:128-937(-)
MGVPRASSSFRRLHSLVAKGADGPSARKYLKGQSRARRHAADGHDRIRADSGTARKETWARPRTHSGPPCSGSAPCATLKALGRVADRKSRAASRRNSRESTLKLQHAMPCCSRRNKHTHTQTHTRTSMKQGRHVSLFPGHAQHIAFPIREGPAEGRHHRCHARFPYLEIAAAAHGHRMIARSFQAMPIPAGWSVRTRGRCCLHAAAAAAAYPPTRKQPLRGNQQHADFATPPSLTEPPPHFFFLFCWLKRLLSRSPRRPCPSTRLSLW